LNLSKAQRMVDAYLVEEKNVKISDM